MNRRDFLRLFAAAAPVAAVAPKYFFAPVGGWHSDLIVHPKDPACFEHVAAAQELSYRLSTPNVNHDGACLDAATIRKVIAIQLRYMLEYGNCVTYTRAVA